MNGEKELVMEKTIGELFKDVFVGMGSFVVLMLRLLVGLILLPVKIWKALGLGKLSIKVFD